jgi:diguanylate cyclase (GGDEF)-like protein
MSSTSLIILDLFLTGSLSFAVGGLIGWFLTRRKALAFIKANEQNPQMLGLVLRLNKMIAELAQDVGSHQTQIEATSNELNASLNAPEKNITEFMVRIVGKILESNDVLQNRLHSAESKLREQRKQIENYLSKAQTDSLTRLPNRRVFDERLKLFIDDFDTRQLPFSLLMIDIDHFKAINDCYGHLAGDSVLRELATILANLDPEHLFVARLGGEEFAVLTSLATAEEVGALSEKCRLAIAGHLFSFECVALSVTISVGTAIYSEGEDTSDLLGRADRALYAAKTAGRNRCFFQNGKICLPIAASDTASEEADGLLEICEDLRQRMAEIVSEEKSHTETA